MKLSSLFAAAGLLLAGMTPVHAALITDWQFLIESEWTEWQREAPFVVGSDPFGVGRTQRLTWGSPGNSFLEVRDTPGSLSTDGGASSIGSLTHFNFPIQNAFFESATLFSHLRLTSMTPGSSSELSIDTSFFLLFEETTNFPASGVCADGSEVPASGCPDIFVLLNPESLIQEFVVDEYRYRLTLFNEGIGLLDDGYCAAAGAPAGCFGFVTAERANNVLALMMRISAERIEQIPEPMTLTLLSLVLLGGWGWERWRGR